jgi:hypothetical protein
MHHLARIVIGASCVLAWSPAHALNQSVHYQITYDSCMASGAPEPFCDQVATAAHNVDNSEFNILAAHGQMENGQTACDGADAAIWRAFWFGQQIRQTAGAVAYDASTEHITHLASFVGRALHVVQDNCAHSGMTNPQHAWKSLDDVCHGTMESPDLVPAAATCAREETDAVLQAVFDSLSDWGADKSVLGNIEDHGNALTSYLDACNYLGSASAWDGVDRRWDNTIVRPFMHDELLSAIASDQAQHRRVCDTTTDGILVGYDADVDVSNGPNGCALISIVCLGKADGDIPPEPDTVPPPPHAGCDAGGGRSTPPLFAIGAIALAARRRARRRSTVASCEPPGSPTST